MASRSSKSDDLFCITRVHPRPRGGPCFLVVIRRQGMAARRSFLIKASDPDGLMALQAAQAWRDEVLKTLPPMTLRQQRTIVRRNNVSGVPGVCRVNRGGTVYWTASLDRSGLPRLYARFSVKTHGEDGAKQRAIEARHQFLQSQADGFYVRTPLSKALCEQNFGDAEQFTRDAMPVAWNKQAALHALGKLRQAGLLKTPAPRIELNRREYPSTGPLWEASVMQPHGERRFCRFKVAKHGEEEAKRLAEAALKQMRAELQAQSPRHPSKKP